MAVSSVGREGLQQLQKATHKIEDFIGGKVGDVAYGAWAGAMVGMLFAPLTLGISVPACTVIFAVDGLLNGTK